MSGNVDLEMRVFRFGPLCLEVSPQQCTFSTIIVSVVKVILKARFQWKLAA